jgi:hypothetical protein
MQKDEFASFVLSVEPQTAEHRIPIPEAPSAVSGSGFPPARRSLSRVSRYQVVCSTSARGFEIAMGRSTQR